MKTSPFRLFKSQSSARFDSPRDACNKGTKSSELWDRIAVLEQGKISEHGSHEELLELEGTYSRLFKLQAKGYQ